MKGIQADKFDSEASFSFLERTKLEHIEQKIQALPTLGFFIRIATMPL